MLANRPTMRSFVPCKEELEGSVPELWEDETVDYKLDHVELAFQVTDKLGLGSLFITSKRLVWLSADNNKAYDFDIPYISLHAISRDPGTYPKACIYCQVDCEEQFNDNEDDEETNEEITEFFIIPEEEKDLMALFEALSHAALLNPDLNDVGEMEGDDDLIYNVDEVNLGADQKKALDHLESVFVIPGEFAGEGQEEEQTKKWKRT